MNKKGMKIFRIVIGAYLTLIGITLFTDVYSQKPTNQILLLLCAIVLIVAGIACIVQSVRKMFNIFKVEKENRDEVEKKAEQERRHKELHSSDKFRTAPMPKAESHENITEFVPNKRKDAPLFAEIKKPMLDEAKEHTEEKHAKNESENKQEPKENNKIVQIRSKREGTTVFNKVTDEDLAIRVVTSDEINKDLEDEAEDEVELAINIEADKETEKEE